MELSVLVEGGRGKGAGTNRLSVERGNKHGLGTFANFHQPSLLRFHYQPTRNNCFVESIS